MIPKQLQNPEFRFNLLKNKEKLPFEKEWQKNAYKYDDEKLIKHIEAGGNYGIIGGYGRLRLLDIDDTKFVPYIEKLFKTFSVKTGKGGRHFYFLSDYDKNHVLADGKGELRGNMQFVVCPGSTHPNGNKYEIIDEYPLLDITEKELVSILEPIFKSSPLVKCDYGKMLKGEATPGERNDGYFRTACLMRFQKIPFDVAKEMIFTANQKNEKPIGKNELERVIKNAYNYKGVKKTEVKEINVDNEALSLYLPNKEEIAENFYRIQPYFYDAIGLFWFWNSNKKCYEQVDEYEVMGKLKETANQRMFQVTQHTFWTETIRSLKLIGRGKHPKEFKKTWIQYKDKIYDYKTKESIEVTPEYFNVNPIPHIIGTSKETPIIDKLLTEWVGKDFVLTMKETIALGCLQDYPLHRMVILFGSGLNGKGSCLRFIEKFIGDSNVCSTNLKKLIKSNFETSKLYKKLLCLMGETDFATLQDTAILKQLTGQDTVSAEFKGKDSFDYRNYATIFIASNSLPATTDKTAGFYRRPLIIDFPNTFEEGKSPEEFIPKEEYENFCLQLLDILPSLIERGRFDKDGNIEERRQKYEEKSNPLKPFIQTNFKEDINSDIPFYKFYDEFKVFCEQRGFREQSKNEVSKQLNEDGYETKRKDIRLPDGSYKQWVHISGLSYPSESSESHITQHAYTKNQVDSDSDDSDDSETCNSAGFQKQPPEESIESDDVQDDTAHLLAIIKERDDKGYPKDEFIEKYSLAVLNRLLELGEVYEPRTGYIMVLP